MNIFSRFIGLFRVPPPQHWNKDAYPVNVWMDESLGSGEMFVNLAVQHINAVAERALLMFPVPAEQELLRSFFDNRDTFTGGIVVQPYWLTGKNGDGFICQSDIRFDKRTGEMRNALVELNLQEGSNADNIDRTVHELCHCLGMKHKPGTLMQATMNAASPRSFDDQQVSTLRGMRK